MEDFLSCCLFSTCLVCTACIKISNFLYKKRTKAETQLFSQTGLSCTGWHLHDIIWISRHIFCLPATIYCLILYNYTLQVLHITCTFEKPVFYFLMKIKRLIFLIHYEAMHACIHINFNARWKVSPHLECFTPDWQIVC